MDGDTASILNPGIAKLTLKHEFSVSVMVEGGAMKNVTISMDDDLYRATRVAAAKAGLSLSSYLANAAREMANREDERQANAQRDAVEAFLRGPLWDVTENGRMPGAEERNAR